MQGIRKDQITFTRFIAAVAIVVSHFGSGVYLFNIETFSFVFKNANLGVSYFFTLSGFIMILAYANNSIIKISKYYKSRFARIAPAYYSALLLFIIPMLSRGWGYDFFELSLNVTMLQAWFPSKALSLNSPGWSLSTELLFYLLFPFLFNSIYKIKNFWFVAVCGVTFFIVSQVTHNFLLSSSFYKGFPSASHDLIYYFPLMHLNEFIIGNIAGLFYIKYMANSSRANGPWIIVSILALLFCLKIPIGLSLHNGLLVIVFIPMILLICSDNGFFSRLMSLKPLVFLGEISFGIYIFQLPVFIFSDSFLKRAGMTDPTMIFLTYLVILGILSALSFKLIETPLRQKINEFRTVPKPLAA